MGADGAAVTVNHASHGSEPDARAFEVLPTMQELENPKELIGNLRVEAHPIVANKNCCDDFGMKRTGLEGGRRSVAGEFDGVLGEIRED